MRVLVALIAFVGLVQAVVWIGRRETAKSRRLLGVFAAPVALLLLCLALVAMRMPTLLF